LLPEITVPTSPSVSLIAFHPPAISPASPSPPGRLPRAPALPREIVREYFEAEKVLAALPDRAGV
jgi:hypothetical protein